MAESTSPSQAPRSRWRRRLLLLAGPVVLVGAGIAFYLHGGRVVSSDNAYVHADKLTVTTEVAGTVKSVSVRDNETVRPGQTLFQLEDEPYRIAIVEARAELENVRLELATQRGTYRQKLAAIEVGREQLAFAEHELERQRQLIATNVGPTAALDQAKHDVEVQKRNISSLQQEAATVLTSLGGLDQPDEKNPRFVAAQARLDRAERDLRRTVITAPIAGIVTNLTNLPAGKFLQPGQPAFSLVGTDRVWIEANLKETELTYLQAGNPVAVEIDTYPHHHWRGQVEGIGPATGAEFALIPPQNASSNWVKTVQRIPVRVILSSSDPARPLRAGMSAHVNIDTGHVRSLRDLTRVFGSDRQG